MTLLTSPAIYSSITAHCISAYPHECCGALIGKSLDDTKTVMAVSKLTNAEPNSPERRFVIDPSELNALDRKCREERVDIVGFYHSHPDAPARPSKTDLEWAWPDYTYVIVSVVDGKIDDFRCFTLDQTTDFSSFVEEPIAASL